jgi:hypothetical protein
MPNTGLKNEKLLVRINSDGHDSVLANKRSDGSYLFKESDKEDGVIVGTLGKPKYDLDEIKKTIATNISELIEVEAPTPEATVLASIYEELQAQYDALVERLGAAQLSLSEAKQSNQLSNAQAEAYDVEIERLKLQIEVLENELKTTTDRFAEIVVDLQHAVNRMTHESIERNSLAARLEAVLAERDTLRDQLFGKTSRISAGAKSSGSLFTVRALPMANTTAEDIYATQRFSVKSLGRGFKSNDNIQWVNGRNGIIIKNESTDVLTLTINKSPEVGGSIMDWYTLVADTDNTVITNIPNIFTITGNGELKLNIQGVTKDAIKSKNSRSNISYITIASISKDNVTESVALSVNLRRDRE